MFLQIFYDLLFLNLTWRSLKLRHSLCLMTFESYLVSSHHLSEGETIVKDLFVFSLVLNLNKNGKDRKLFLRDKSVTKRPKQDKAA